MVLRPILPETAKKPQCHYAMFLATCVHTIVDVVSGDVTPPSTPVDHSPIPQGMMNHPGTLVDLVTLCFKLSCISPGFAVLKERMDTMMETAIPVQLGWS